MCHPGLLVLLITSVVNVVSPTSNAAFTGSVTDADKEKFKNTFLKYIDSPVKDPSQIYHVLLGLHHLSQKLPDAKSTCSLLEKPIAGVDQAFYSVMSSKLLGANACKFSTPDITKTVNAKLTEDISPEDLYFAVSTLTTVGAKVDTKKVTSIVNRLMSKDPNPNTLAYIFQVVPQLGLPKSELNSFTATLISSLESADELDDNQLFYRRGVYTTALMAQSVLAFSNALGEIPTGVDDKIVKLFNFLHTRLETTNLRTLAHIVAAFNILANCPLILPIVVTHPIKTETPKLFKIDQAKPVFDVQLLHVWNGQPMSADEVEMKAKGLYSGLFVDKLLGNELVGPAERGLFKKLKTSVFQFTLNSADIPPCGYYHLVVTGKSKKEGTTRKLLGISDSRIPLLVVSDVDVYQPKLTIMDNVREQHVADIALQFGKLYKSPGADDPTIKLQPNQQFSLEFKLNDFLKGSFKAHQLFVQLRHQVTKQAITFVCGETVKNKQTGEKVYSLYLDPYGTAPDFDYLSGMYEASLIVGDSSLKKPVIWHMFNIDIQFPGLAGSESKRQLDIATDVTGKRTPSVAGSKRANSIVGDGPTRPKPEIKHIFRSPEKRAPLALALLFTGLCLLPVVFLLIGWLSVGVNLSNFKFKPANIIFHSGLIAICCLYYMYWTKLDMFTTIGYLILLGVPTFLAGNSVLRAQVVARLSSASAGNQSTGTKKH